MAGALLSALLGQTASAQSGRATGQGGRYDPSTESKLSGQVSAVENVMPPDRTGRQGMGGLHLTLKTSTESVVVHLGPAAFLKEKNFVVAVGDDLEILGSRVKLGDESVLIAREIKQGERTLTLRDASGRPLWSGGQR
jgi:hypothetical protein